MSEQPTQQFRVSRDPRPRRPRAPALPPAPVPRPSIWPGDRMIGMPWQGPPRPQPRPRYDRSQLWMAGIFATAIVIIVGICAWFLAEVIPG